MIERDIRKLVEKVDNQKEQIPLFRKTDDAFQIADMIAEEAQELVDELESASVTDDLTQVAGEVGDVLYLALKMCNTLGLNPDDVIRMKIARNEDKYGQQSERDVAKREWKEKGGDRAWYEEYLLTTAIIEED